MALFTDGTIARLDDLRAFESSVLDLASAEGIDVSAKLRIAQREFGTELVPFLTRNGHGRDLSNVVVTDAVLDAHALRTLSLIYRDLYQSRLNDRYEGKWREYAAQSDRAMRMLLESGVGINSTPIAKAAAPLAGSANGSLLPARTYYVRIAWTRDARVTGALSDAVGISIAPGERLTVSVASLPSSISGWLLYVGTSGGQPWLQTAEAVTSLSTWTEPDSGLRTDLESWPVQSAHYYVATRREIQRG